MASLWRDQGMSTAALRAWFALRMRVSMSATGSVSMVLPAGLREAGNLSLAGQVAQAEAAHAETPEERPGPPAERAAVVRADLELRRPRGLHHQSGFRHESSLRAERHAERTKQRLALGVATGGRADRHGQTLDLVDLVEVDLREDH